MATAIRKNRLILKSVLLRLITATLVMWALFSGAEVSAHNSATLSGNTHEYSAWNVFAIVEELFNTAPLS